MLTSSIARRWRARKELEEVLKKSQQRRAKKAAKRQKQKSGYDDEVAGMLDQESVVDSEMTSDDTDAHFSARV